MRSSLPTRIHVFGVPGLPGSRRRAPTSAALLAQAVRAQRTSRSRPGDVFVVAQKIVSKAEGAVVRLDQADAVRRAAASGPRANGKDPAVVEVVLRESRRIVRMERGIIIAETRHGFVCANAGVDASNVAAGIVTVLPRDPDASAARLRTASAREFGVRVGGDRRRHVRPSVARRVVNVALGVAGLRPLARLARQTRIRTAAR